MQLSQIPKVTSKFDEGNLIAQAGLDPVMQLARRAGLGGRVATKVMVPGPAGHDTAGKVSSIVAGMIAGADSIDDVDVLREGAVRKVLPGVYTPSTLGTFLRAFTFGQVQQLTAAAGGLLAGLAALVVLLAGATGHRDAVTWVDVDNTHARDARLRQAGRGLGVQQGQRAQRVARGGLHPGTPRSWWGRCCAAGQCVRGDPMPADSAFYTHKIVAAIVRSMAQFSITARMDKAIEKAIAAIPDKAWISIKYPQAIFDEEQQRWISDAQVAETTYAAFRSLSRRHHAG